GEALIEAGQFAQTSKEDHTMTTVNTETEKSEARHCFGCQRDWMDPELAGAPMVNDDVWAKLGEPDDLLCEDCFFDLIKEKDIRVGLAELRPCLFNLDLWFDHFFEGDEPDEVMTAWYDVLIGRLPGFLHKDLAKR